MNHVRVDDEMHRRVMSAVSKALDEQAVSEDKSFEKAISYEDVLDRTKDYEREHGVSKVETTPIRRKAKLSMIRILSIAAAAILVSGVVYFAVKYIQGMPVKEHSKMMVMNEAQATQAAAETTAADGPEIDAALGGNNHMDAVAGGNKNYIGAKKTTKGADEETTASTEAAESETDTEEGNRQKDSFDTEAPAGDANTKDSFENNLPFKVKTVGTSTIGEEKIRAVVYTGDRGEKLVIYSAKEGTDIAKKVLPEFKGVPATLQTGGGQKFYAIDTSVGKNKQVNKTGPYDAVSWTKDGYAYMIVLNGKTDVGVFISLMEKI